MHYCRPDRFGIVPRWEPACGHDRSGTGKCDYIGPDASQTDENLGEAADGQAPHPQTENDGDASQDESLQLVLNLVKATLVPRLKQNPVWNLMTFPRLSIIFRMSCLSLAGNQVPNLAKVPPIPRPSLIREEIAMSGFSLVKMTIRPRLTRNQFRMRRPARHPQGAAGAPARRYLRRNPNPMLLTLRPPMRRKPIQGSPKNSGCLAAPPEGRLH